MSGWRGKQQKASESAVQRCRDRQLIVRMCEFITVKLNVVCARGKVSAACKEIRLRELGLWSGSAVNVSVGSGGLSHCMRSSTLVNLTEAWPGFLIFEVSLIDSSQGKFKRRHQPPWR